MDSVVLINPVEVAAGLEEEFLASWREAADYMRQQEGYISTALHQSLDPQSRFRFVNVAVWRSPEHFQRALGSSDFQGLAADLPYKAFPGLYQVVAN